jgi:hypothetical protein
MHVTVVVTAAAQHMLHHAAPLYAPEAWRAFQAALLPRSELVVPPGGVDNNTTASHTTTPAAAESSGQTATSTSTSTSTTTSTTSPAALGRIVAVATDQDEWHGYADIRGDTVLHIDLRKWADVCVVAPCSANTLAKAAAGMSDNLVSCVLRAWDFAKPALVAPAMNT